MTSHAGLIGAEPKDGDFVAYLLDIERRQLAAMDAARLINGPSSVPPLLGLPAPAPRPGQRASTQAASRRGRAHDEQAPLNKEQAAAVLEVLSSHSQARTALASQEFVGGLVIAAIALFFFVAGAAGGNVVPVLIGTALGWLAVTRLRKAFRGGSGDLAERLQRGGFRS
ncbi:MAG: hypothetical protein ING59_06455 [Burkholderiales bacterium]|jgi:hypothetical protein|nr:hypothetical protein [Burkholderiales bacterium]